MRRAKWYTWFTQCELYYDMAGSLSNRRYCGSLGTTNSQLCNRLIWKQRAQILSHKGRGGILCGG